MLRNSPKLNFLPVIPSPDGELWGFYSPACFTDDHNPWWSLYDNRQSTLQPAPNAATNAYLSDGCRPADWQRSAEITAAV